MPGGGHGATFFVAVYTLRLEGLDGGSKAAGIARVDPQEAHMARVLPGKKILGGVIYIIPFCCSSVVYVLREERLRARAQERGSADGAVRVPGVPGLCFGTCIGHKTRGVSVGLLAR